MLHVSAKSFEELIAPKMVALGYPESFQWHRSLRLAGNTIHFHSFQIFFRPQVANTLDFI